MENKDILQELCNIVNDGVKGLTAERMAFVKEQCEVNGIEFEPSKKCRNCYLDKAAELYRLMKPEQATEGRKIMLKEDTNILFNGALVNEATTDTDEKCEKLLQAGLDEKYFIINED